jgi:hypothetical protein
VYKLTIAIILMSLVGCASVPANYGKPKVGSKIGVMLLIDEAPTYQHIGTTIFSNENFSEISNTNYHQKFNHKISTLFTQSGHVPELIDANASLLENKNSLFGYIDFKDKYKATLDEIAKNNALDFIVIVYPPSGPAWVNSSAYLSGYGLYSRCMFGSCDAYALNYVSARIYDAKNKTSLNPMDFRFFAQVPLPEINIPDEPKDIQAEQVDKAADKALNNFMTKFTEMLRTSEFI